MPTNVFLGMSYYTLSHAGVCGASVAVSFTLSSPAHNMEPQGRVTIMVTNETTVAPIHIEPRLLFTDLCGAEISLPLAVGLLSNTQPFGSAQSALQIQGLFMMLSGQDAAIPLVGVAGSGLRVVIMAASNTASGTNITGTVAAWKL